MRFSAGTTGKSVTSTAVRSAVGEGLGFIPYVGSVLAGVSRSFSGGPGPQEKELQKENTITIAQQRKQRLTYGFRIALAKLRWMLDAQGARPLLRVQLEEPVWAWVSAFIGRDAWFFNLAALDKRITLLASEYSM
jgi:hypothetical protein